MAFFSKVGSLLRQTVSKQISCEISASRTSIYQAIRCMSSSKLFVGGLSYQTDEQGLREAFGKYGYVNEARVINDRESGRSRGFGFVTFSTPEEATSAIQALDGQELHGRRVRVNYATDRARGGGGGGYGGGYGGSYGGQGGYGGGGGSYGGSYGGNYGNNAYGAPSGNYGGNRVDNNGSGGNYGSSYGGESASYGGAGNFSSGNTFDGGNTGGFSTGGGNYGVAGGAGGIDGDGIGFGGGNQFDSSDNQVDSNESGSSFSGASEPLEANTRDDFEDDDGDFAKRA